MDEDYIEFSCLAYHRILYLSIAALVLSRQKRVKTDVFLFNNITLSYFPFMFGQKI